MSDYSSATWILLVFSMPILTIFACAPILVSLEKTDSPSALIFHAFHAFHDFKVTLWAVYLAGASSVICLIALIARQLREHVTGTNMHVWYLTLFRPLWLSLLGWISSGLVIDFILNPPAGWFSIKFIAGNLNSLCEVAVGLSLAFTLLDSAHEYAKRIVSENMNMLSDPTYSEVFSFQVNESLKANNVVANSDKISEIEKANSTYQIKAQKLLATGMDSLTAYAKFVGLFAACLFLGLLSWLAVSGSLKFIYASTFLGVVAAIVFPASLHTLLLMSVVRHANEKFTDVFHSVLPSAGRAYAKEVRKKVVKNYISERDKQREMLSKDSGQFGKV
jgi:hypothetical protein